MIGIERVKNEKGLCVERGKRRWRAKQMLLPLSLVLCQWRSTVEEM